MAGLFYAILKKYCSAALWFYYSKWQVHHHEPVPTGAVIFVANHQNSFLDALLVACSTTRNPWFLARANVFKIPCIRLVLTWLKMRPVFRFRDGFSTLRRNDEMIAGCVDLLRQGQSIVIFAEGNHNTKWQLRPLQKGFARIALEAAKKKIEVKIVPVALQYDVRQHNGARVLVSFGKSISVNTTTDVHGFEKETIAELIQQTSTSLQLMMLHIDTTNYCDDVNQFLASRQNKADLVEQLQMDQQLIRDLKSATRQSSVVKSVQPNAKPQWTNAIFAYYVINHTLPTSFIRWIVKTNVKEEQFIESLTFTIGMFLVPIFYVLQTSAVYFLSHSFGIAAVYFMSLPASFIAARRNSNIK